MGSGCLRKKPGSSSRLPKALRTGAVVRGCLFRSCSLSPPAHPTHHFSHPQQQPNSLWHMQKGVYFSDEEDHKTSRKQAATRAAACREVQTGSGSKSS